MYICSGQATLTYRVILQDYITESSLKHILIHSYIDAGWKHTVKSYTATL